VEGDWNSSKKRRGGKSTAEYATRPAAIERQQYDTAVWKKRGEGTEGKVEVKQKKVAGGHGYEGNGPVGGGGKQPSLAKTRSHINKGMVGETLRPGPKAQSGKRGKHHHHKIKKLDEKEGRSTTVQIPNRPKPSWDLWGRIKKCLKQKKKMKTNHIPPGGNGGEKDGSAVIQKEDGKNK